MTGGGHRLQRALRRWWHDGALNRPGARRRYATILVVVMALVSLPAVIGAIPVSAKSVPMATLLDRIRASGAVAYTGLASASGGLLIPDLGVGNAVTDLLSGTNRLQAWYADPTHYRVDHQTVGGESDVYHVGAGQWTWDSDRRLAVFELNRPQIPLPGPQDALPGDLARRLLADAAASTVTPLSARRIAGRTALGLLWLPHDTRSLISQVKVWADQDTGLPLAVEVRAVGSQSRSFSSSFLDIAFKAPSASVLSFHPEKDPTASTDTGEQDIPQDQEPQAQLPATVGGLKQRSPESPTVATYGQGASIVAVSELSDRFSALALEQQIISPSRPAITGKFGTGALFETPLLTGLVFATRGRGYVLLGSVTRAQLEVMALDLEQHPIRRRP